MPLRAYDQDQMFLLPLSLNGLERPDFRTLCLFRTNNREALEKIFADVIVIARSMGMATLGLVALDGSKIRANCGIDTFKKLEDWKEALNEARKQKKTGRLLAISCVTPV